MYRTVEGRNGGQSTYVLVYNDLLSAHCDADMNEYIYIEECLRKWLMSHFSHADHLKFDFLHNCCNNRMQLCKCKALNLQSYGVHKQWRSQRR